MVVAVRPEQKAVEPEPEKEVHATNVIRNGNLKNYVRFVPF